MPARVALVVLALVALVPAADTRQPAPPNPAPRTSEIEAWLHAGRFADALVAITRRLPTDTPPVASRDERLSVVELALLGAIVSESPAAANLVTPDRLTGRDVPSYWFVQGVLAARAAWPGGRPEPLKRARDAAERLDALAAVEGRWSRTEVRRVSILAAIAAAQEERDEFTLLATHASQLDGNVRELRVPDDQLLPWDELAGDLWLQIHRFDDALKCYRRATERHPERTRAWIGRARAAREAGDMDEARSAAGRVLAAWGPDRGIEGVRTEMTAIVGQHAPGNQKREGESWKRR